MSLEVIEELILELEPKAKEFSKEAERKAKRPLIENNKKNIKEDIDNYVTISFLCAVIREFSREGSGTGEIRTRYSSGIMGDVNFDYWGQEDKKELVEYFKNHIEKLQLDTIPLGLFTKNAAKISDRLLYVTGVKKAEMDIDDYYYLTKEEEKEVMDKIRKINLLLFDIILNPDSKIPSGALKILLELSEYPFIIPIKKVDYFQNFTLLYKFGSDGLNEVQQIVKNWIHSSPEAKIEISEVTENFNKFIQYDYLLDKKEIEICCQRFEGVFQEKLKNIQENLENVEITKAVFELKMLKTDLEALNKIKEKTC